MLCLMLGRLFEPYVVHLLPSLLMCFGDSNQYVREVSNSESLQFRFFDCTLTNFSLQCVLKAGVSQAYFVYNNIGSVIADRRLMRRQRL